MPDDRRDAGRRRRRCVIGQPCGKPDAHGSFGHVEERHHHTGGYARRSHDIGGSEIAAANKSKIGDAPLARHEQRKGNGSDQVAEHYGEEH